MNERSALVALPQAPNQMQAELSTTQSSPATVGYQRTQRQPKSLSVDSALVWFMLIASGIACGAWFAIMVGAWLALPFAGLEVALVGFALRWVVLQPEVVESIIVDGDLIVVSTNTANKIKEWRFNREWAVLEYRERGARFDLWFRYRGRQYSIGKAVGDVERKSLMQELRAFVKVQAVEA